MALDAGIEPRQLAGWRVLSAALLMTGVPRRAAADAVPLQPPGAPSASRCSALFGVTLPQWLYYEAISRFDVGLTLVIVYTAPLWVAGIHRVTRGTRQPRQVTVAMGLGAGRASRSPSLAAAGSPAHRLLGFVLAVATSLAYTAQLMLADRLDTSLPASSRLALSMIFAAVFWLLLPAVRDLPTDLLRSDVPFGQLDFQVPLLLLIAYVVIGGTIAAVRVPGRRRRRASAPSRRA